MPSIPYPNTVVDSNGMMTDEFRRWVVAVTNSDIMVGTGTPEASVSATVGRLYMNDAGASGSILYIKRDADIAGDTTKGWILV